MPGIGRLIDGLLVILTPQHLAVVLAGVVIGLTLALLPGLGSPFALLPAVLVPWLIVNGSLTGLLPGEGPFGWVGLTIAGAPLTMLAAMYCGARFGATASGILYGLPGDVGAIHAGAAGHALVRAGRGVAALSAAVFGTFAAALIAVPVVSGVMPLLARYGTSLGPPEWALFGIAGMAAAAGLLGRSLARGALSLGIGVTVAMVGTDPMYGSPRFTFGVDFLLNGVPPLLLLLGLLIVGEVLHRAPRPWWPGSATPVPPRPGPGLPAPPSAAASGSEPSDRKVLAWATPARPAAAPDVLESWRAEPDVPEPAMFGHAGRPGAAGESETSESAGTVPADAEPPDAPGTDSIRTLWARCWRPAVRGAVIGLPLGMFAALTPEVPARLSGLLERRLGRRRSGAATIETVAGSEAASAAAGTGLLLPLIVLGFVTGSMTAATTAGYAFTLGPLDGVPENLRAAPALDMLAAILVASVLLLLLVLPLARLMALAARIPPAVLYGIAVTVAAAASYAAVRHPAGLVLLAVFGLLGALMRKADVPLTPAVIGYLLAVRTETAVRESLAIGQGDPAAFVRTPTGVVLLVVIAVVVLGPPAIRAGRAASRPATPRA